MNLIKAVGAGAQIPAGAEVIDGKGKTLLPGLIDAHTHVFTEDALRQALIFGVTTELDMFMEHSLAAELRQHQAENGAVDRADLDLSREYWRPRPVDMAPNLACH